MAALDPDDDLSERALDAIRTLVRYGASLARLRGMFAATPAEGGADGDGSRGLQDRGTAGESDHTTDDDVARVLARSMNRARAEQLVEIAAHIEIDLARQVHQARVGQAAVEVARVLRQSGDLGHSSSTKEQWLGKRVEEVCAQWELPLHQKLPGAALEIARAILTPSHMSEQAHIASVIGGALFPSEAWGERTMSGVLAALGGTEQKQGLLRDPGVAHGALHTDPLHHDVALWAMSLAFPTASHEQLAEMVRAAGRILRTPSQSSLPPLQTADGETKLSHPCAAEPDDSE